MSTIAALVSGFGWHVTDLQRAAGRLGQTLHALPFAQVSASIGGSLGNVRVCGHELAGLDGILVRMMPPGTLEQVVFRMDALHRLADAGVPIWNPPRAVEAAVDKYLTLSLLDRAGIDVPETWAGQSAGEALAAFGRLGGDVVVKPLFGSEGRGLVRVSEPELAWRTFQTLERLGAVLYLQRMIRHPGHDLRVFVLEGRVLGAMRRVAPGPDWRTNVARGGRAEPCRLDSGAERLALAATAAIGAKLAGVDLIDDLDRGRLVVLEVNAVPGWRALSKVTGIDVASEILAALGNSRR